MKKVYLLSVLVLVVYGYNAENLNKDFQEWMNKYNIVYSNPTEQNERMQVFLENVRFIEEWNSVPGRHRLELNAFGDLRASEYISYARKHPERLTSINKKKNALPSVYYVDWRQKGAVGPVADQGQSENICGLTTAESIEGCAAIASKHFVSLSVDQIQTCVTSEICSDSWKYVVKVGGVVAAGAPYTCNSGQWAATIKGYEAVTPSGSEQALEAAVNMTTPQCGVNAGLTSWQFYSGGVYDDPGCTPEIDHSVLVVGYGYDSTSRKDFWILKNSWGEDWGLDGYLWLAKDHDNLCGIATEAYYGTGCE